MLPSRRVPGLQQKQKQLLAFISQREQYAMPESSDAPKRRHLSPPNEAMNTPERPAASPLSDIHTAYDIPQRPARTPLRAVDDGNETPAKSGTLTPAEREHYQLGGIGDV